MFKRVYFTVFFLAIFISSAYALELKGGFAERVMYEFKKNMYDLENGAKDNRNYFRFRTSLWGQADISKDLDFYVRLTNENYAYIYWGGANAAAGKSATKKGYHYDINEVVFDNLYADIKDVGGLPLDLRLGRQDLFGYGEGFLISDGTPIDTNRTFYFNAAKASWQVDPKNTVDFIFIKDNKTDDLLPIINPVKGEQALNTSDEVGYMIYHKSDISKKLHAENYYIYKFEDDAGAGSRTTAEKTRLNTIGSFANYKFSPWALRGQLALQFGKYGNEDRQGLGGYAYLDRYFKNVKWSPKLSLGFIHLSGNKTDSKKNEAWDPLFSRVKFISLIMGYAYNSETSVNYWTNLQAYRLTLELLPIEKL